MGVVSVTSSISDRIKIARTLCIFFMTFVHVQPGIAENVYDRDTGVFDIVYFILTRMLGLSSVSLLSVVSGYFIVSSLLKAGTMPLISSKLKTLVVPLVAWNVAMFALLIAYGLIRQMAGHAGADTARHCQRVSRADRMAADCTALVPARPLRLLPVRHRCFIRASPFPDATMLARWSLSRCFGENLYILQRPQLMLFFGLACGCARRRFDEKSDRPHRRLPGDRPHCHGGDFPDAPHRAHSAGARWTTRCG